MGLANSTYLPPPVMMESIDCRTCPRMQSRLVSRARAGPGRPLRWRAEDLARNSAVGVATIRRAELADSATSMTAANDLAIRRALEAPGVEFIDENGGGPGVRLRPRSRPMR
jgi:hypothetical protein